MNKYESVLPQTTEGSGGVTVSKPLRWCGIPQSASTLGWACGDCFRCADRPKGRYQPSSAVLTEQQVRAFAHHSPIEDK